MLAGFTKVLLLPVTIIPKTAMYGVNAITYGGTAVIDTFAHLGTQLSGGAAGGTGAGAGGSGTRTPSAARPGGAAAAAGESSAAAWGGEAATAPRLSVDASGVISVSDGTTTAAAASSSSSLLEAGGGTSASRAPGRFDRLQLLLSLDTALQLLQADRDSLKRIQTFLRFPGTYGRKVRDAIEEVFIVLLQVLNEKHVGPAFDKARRQMETYKPEEHDGETVGGGGGGVAPLVQFFELVHIGDTIQQMVDVYYEKEMVRLLSLLLPRALSRGCTVTDGERYVRRRPTSTGATFSTSSCARRSASRPRSTTPSRRGSTPPSTSSCRRSSTSSRRARACETLRPTTATTLT